MRAPAVGIGDILGQDPLQIALVKYENMVQALGPDRSDPALRDCVCSRRSEWRANLGNTKIAHPTIECGTITAVAVMNEETSRSSVPRAAFDHLLRRPRGGRMPRHMNIDNLPTGVMDNDRRPRWLDPASSSHRSMLSLISSHEFACEVMKCTSPAEISCSASDKITNDRLFDVRLVKGAPLAMQAVQPR